MENDKFEIKRLLIYGVAIAIIFTFIYAFMLATKVNTSIDKHTTISPLSILGENVNTLDVKIHKDYYSVHVIPDEELSAIGFALDGLALNLDFLDYLSGFNRLSAISIAKEELTSYGLDIPKNAGYVDVISEQDIQILNSILRTSITRSGTIYEWKETTTKGITTICKCNFLLELDETTYYIYLTQAKKRSNSSALHMGGFVGK